MPHFPFERHWLKKPDKINYEIDWSNKLTKGLKHLFILNEDGGAPYDLVTKQFMTGTVGAPFGGGGTQGRYLAGDGNDSYWMPIPVYQHPITIAAIGSKNNKTAASTILGLGENANTGGMFLVSPRAVVDNEIRAYIRSRSGDSIQFISGEPGYNIGQDYLIAATASSSTDVRLWVDGRYQGQNTGNHGSTMALDRLAFMGLTRNTSVADHDGTASFGAVWNAAFDDLYHIELANNPWQLIKLESDWMPVSANAGANVTLTIQDALHAHSSDNLVLGQNNQLIVADAVHSHTVDDVLLVQDHQLVIAKAVHAHNVNNLLLTQNHQLVIENSLHSSLADNVVLSVATALVIAGTVHLHSVDNVPLAQDHQLVIAKALHAHAADSIWLAQDHVLIVSDALHAIVSDNVALAIPSTVVTPSSRIFVIDHDRRTYVVTV